MHPTAAKLPPHKGRRMRQVLQPRKIVERATGTSALFYRDKPPGPAAARPDRKASPLSLGNVRLDLGRQIG